MILCITNQCNRRCDFCFEGAFRDGPEQMMSVEDVERICRFARYGRAYGPGVAVMGGEPTLHPDLLRILAFLRQQNRSAKIQILTNLLCDEDILRPMTPLAIDCLVNVGGFPTYSSGEQERVLSNLSLLRENRIFSMVWLAVTITDGEQDFGFLYDLLEADRPKGIRGIRIGISAPGMGFANEFPREFSPSYGAKYLEVVERCHRIRPSLGFANECPVNMCMVPEDIVARLERVVKNLNNPCTGNFDILPDFSTHWCFAFEGVPEMSVENIFRYQEMREVHAVLRSKAVDMDRALDVGCDSRGCSSLGCRGPCLAWRYYLASRQAASP